MKLIINSNPFIIEEHCKPLVWQRILVISWSMPRQKSLILQFFSGTQEKDLFPCLVCLWRSTSWNRGILLGTLEWAAALGICHIPPRPPMYTALCVCVYVCVGISSEQCNGLAWHPNNHYPLGPKQATLLLHYTGTQAGKNKQTKGSESSFNSMSLRVSFSGFQTIWNKCWGRKWSHVWLPQNCNVLTVTGKLIWVVTYHDADLKWPLTTFYITPFHSNIAEVSLPHYRKRTDETD